MDWKSLPEGKEKRHAYYCSREWGMLKEKVHRRAGGMCERCYLNPIGAVHHLTYIRLYQERLTDLQGICEGCHAFTHGKSETDPAEWVSQRAYRRRMFAPEHEIFVSEMCFSSLFNCVPFSTRIDAEHFTNLGLRILFEVACPTGPKAFLDDRDKIKIDVLSDFLAEKYSNQPVYYHSAIAAVCILDWDMTIGLLPNDKSIHDMVELFVPKFSNR